VISMEYETDKDGKWEIYREENGTIVRLLIEPSNSYKDEGRILTERMNSALEIADKNSIEVFIKALKDKGIVSDNDLTSAINSLKTVK